MPNGGYCLSLFQTFLPLEFAAFLPVAFVLIKNVASLLFN